MDSSKYDMVQSVSKSTKTAEDPNSPVVGRDLLSASDESVDSDMLARAVAEAGRWAFGIMAADVWVLSDDQTRLVQPSGGFWIDPVWSMTEPSEALERLSDSTRSDYCRPATLRPGEGLGGALWNDVHPGGADGPGAGLMRNFMGRNASARGGGGGGDFGGNAGIGRAVVWRDVNGLANDPHQPYNEKVVLLAEAGFGLAAAVPFNVRGHRGIVVYLGRRAADPEKLRSDLNEEYLQGATDVIGAVSALRRPRQACIDQRREEARRAIRRAKIKILAYVRTSRYRKEGMTFPSTTGDPNVPMGNEEEGPAPPMHETGPLAVGYTCSQAVGRVGENFKDHAIMWGKKLSGGGVLPSPVMPLPQAIFGTICAFISMAIVLELNLFITSKSDLQFILGPISSLQTMGYGLTQAPAAQPRNMILANIVSVPTAMILRYIYARPSTWKSALTVGLTVGLQTSMGITHPPATAMAFLFAISTRDMSTDWKNFGLVLVANIVVIGTDTIFNNLSQQRQYPTYWGYLPSYLYRKMKECREKDDKDEEEEEKEPRKTL